MLRGVGGLDSTEGEAVNLASDRIKHLGKQTLEGNAEEMEW
jgi:hypothetical protein